MAEVRRCLTDGKQQLDAPAVVHSLSDRVFSAAVLVGLSFPPSSLASCWSSSSSCSGVVVVESVFGLGGLGQASVQAIFTGDLPVIIGFVIIAATFVVVANIIVDLAYALLGPPGPDHLSRFSRDPARQPRSRRPATVKVTQKGKEAPAAVTLAQI